jgi:NAD-dependent dihydropyrimidine dehydrogenase PreA subunit
MPFTKTEVDIHDDYTVEAVDAAWLAQGVKSPKHLMLDPDNCILCRACEDVCPWDCIYMLAPDIVADGQSQEVTTLAQSSHALFVIDDNECVRCGICIDRCPTGALWYARVGEGKAAAKG